MQPRRARQRNTWRVPRRFRCNLLANPWVCMRAQGRVKPPKQAQLLYSALASLEGRAGAAAPPSI